MFFDDENEDPNAPKIAPNDTIGFMLRKFGMDEYSRNKVQAERDAYKDKKRAETQAIFGIQNQPKEIAAANLRVSPLIGEPGQFDADNLMIEAPKPERKPAAKEANSPITQEAAQKIIASPNTSPALKEALVKKFDLGEYSDANRSKLVEDSKTGMGDKVSAALAALGAGFMGQNAAAAGNSVLDRARQRGQDALTNFDKGRANKIQEYDMDRRVTQASREDQEYNDLNSADSDYTKSLQQAAVKRGMSQDVASKLTGAQLLKHLPFLQQDEEVKMKKEALTLDRQMKQQELALKKSQAGDPANAFKRLPEEKKQVIEGLAKKNANKIAISNQIDSVLNNTQGVSESEQLQQYRQLIKVLNSTEGADAVGAEEAKRLAGKLEFAMGNFTNDNPTQFGRDLKGFRNDAALTSKAMKDAVNQNNKMIDEAYGRVSPRADSKSKLSIEDQQAIEWAKANPKDPRATQILRMHGM